jgi:hypothetical protein
VQWAGSTNTWDKGTESGVPGLKLGMMPRLRYWFEEAMRLMETVDGSGLAAYLEPGEMLMRSTQHVGM